MTRRQRRDEARTLALSADQTGVGVEVVRDIVLDRAAATWQHRVIWGVVYSHVSDA